MASYKTHFNACTCFYILFFGNHNNGKVKRIVWPCRLRRRVSAASLLGLRVLIPPGSGMCLSLVRVVCYNVDLSAMRRSLVQRRSTEGGVYECDLDRLRRGLGPPELSSHVKRKDKIVPILWRSGSTTTHIIQLGTRCRAPWKEPRLSNKYDVDTYVCPIPELVGMRWKKSLPLSGIEREDRGLVSMTEISSFKQN